MLIYYLRNYLHKFTLITGPPGAEAGGRSPWCRFAPSGFRQTQKGPGSQARHESQVSTSSKRSNKGVVKQVPQVRGGEVCYFRLGDPGTHIYTDRQTDGLAESNLYSRLGPCTWYQYLILGR